MLVYSYLLLGLAASLVTSSGGLGWEKGFPEATSATGQLSGPDRLFLLSGLRTFFNVSIERAPVREGFFPAVQVSGHDNSTGKLLATQILNTTTTGFTATVSIQLNSTGFGYVAVSACGVEDPSVCCSPLYIPVTVAPGVISILPLILTIVVAIATRQVLLSLLLGLWMCGMFLSNYNPFTGLLSTLDFLWVNGLASSSHAAIIIFTFLLGGFLSVLHSAKGGEGVARLLAGKGTESARRASLSTLLLSCLLFFDDYTSIILAGNTMEEAFAGAAHSYEKEENSIEEKCPSIKKRADSGRLSSDKQKDEEAAEEAVHRADPPHHALVATIQSKHEKDNSSSALTNDRGIGACLECIEDKEMELISPNSAVSEKHDFDTDRALSPRPAQGTSERDSQRSKRAVIVDGQLTHVIETALALPDRRGTAPRGCVPRNSQNDRARDREIRGERDVPAQVVAIVKEAATPGSFVHLPEQHLGIISREKVGLIVHGVGVCTVSFFPISSWVGVELGYIQAATTALPLSLRPSFDPFMVFLRSIPYRVFPVTYILFLLAVCITRRDFGGIHKKERELYLQRKSRKLKRSGIEPISLERSSNREEISVGKGSEHDEAKANDADGDKKNRDPPVRWVNAVIPLMFVILASVAGMFASGYLNAKVDLEKDDVSVVEIFAHFESLNALLWAMFGGTLVLFVLVLPQKVLNLSSAMKSWVKGVEEVAYPIVILSLAWALGDAIKSIHTAEYIAVGLGQGMPLAILPFITAVTSYLMAFATGSGFGTMGVLTPLFVPIAFSLSGSGQGEGGVGASVDAVAEAVGAVFGGAAFGSVYSPIADDTILTSLSIGCDVSAHVNSQLPYGVLVGVVTLLATLLVGVVPPYLSFVPFLAATASLIAILFIFGRTPEQPVLQLSRCCQDVDIAALEDIRVVIENEPVEFGAPDIEKAVQSDNNKP